MFFKHSVECIMADITKYLIVAIRYLILRKSFDGAWDLMPQPPVTAPLTAHSRERESWWSFMVTAVTEASGCSNV